MLNAARREAREEGLAEGREEGLAEGREEGELYGKIRTLQSLLNQALFSIEELKVKSRLELEAMATELQTLLRKRMA
jgi:flagellar biosynthesis/type III secretory pathway protein FliH